jgi:hypothetical protein
METHGALGPRPLAGPVSPHRTGVLRDPVDAKRQLVPGPINGYIGPRPKALACESARLYETTVGGIVHDSGQRGLA